MLLTALMLTAGLPATSAPPAGPQKGWVVELRGYTSHPGARPKAPWVVEFQGPQPEAALKVEPVEAQNYDDLRPVLEQLKKQKP
jgi:hypothetical protein